MIFSREELSVKRLVGKLGTGRFLLYTCAACIGCSLFACSMDVVSDMNDPPPTWTPGILITISPFPTLTIAPSNTPANTETAPPADTPAPTGTITSTPYPPNAECVPTNTAATYATVIGITDGDTIIVQFEDGTTASVRYIGMDAPETGDALSIAATNRNSDLTAMKTAMLVKDVSEVDRFDRLLRYVIVDGVFINYSLVQEGYAWAKSYPPDTACDEAFKAAEEAARNETTGIWASLPLAGESTPLTRGGDATENIVIIYIFYDGVEGDKEPDEYVEIRNDGSGSINLQGWTLVDKADHTYRFPDYTIEPGEVCRIYTNQIHEEWCGFSYGFTGSAIWNNSGDCAYLRDGSFSLIDDYCY
jgi:micrococcal nuclease